MRVRFTRPAQADLKQTYAYVSRENPVQASRLVAGLVERARAIGDSPFFGRETDEQNVRVVIAPKLRHLIFYAVKDGEVHITHIRHTSRRPWID